MAQIRKRVGERGGNWQIDCVDPGVKRVRKNVKKKKDAEAVLGERVALIAEERYLDVKKNCKTTLKELADRYAKTISTKHIIRIAHGTI